MSRFLLGFLPLVVLPAALRAEDKPRDRPRENRAVTAAAEYRGLMDEYRKTLQASDARFEKARTREQRQKIRATFQQFRAKLVGRLLAFAEKYPREKEALSALFFVLHPDTYAERRAADRAVQLLLKDHVRSDRLGALLSLLAVQDFPVGEKPLREILKKNPHPARQAQACLGLALLLREKAAGSPGQAARLTAEAEQLFERVVTRYAGVKAVAAKARTELFEIRHLSVGKAMPDLRGKDSGGKDLKLSDYRGKVVVLIFWAAWCPPCMAMVPHERSLVKRLAGKPFALLGVNRDPSRASLEQCEKKHRITWQSFFDGRDGPISKEHNIKRMPTIYVMDARGVIRYKGVRGEALDRAVDQLLAELEKGREAPR
jgi:peroxiredoxin